MQSAVFISTPFYQSTCFTCQFLIKYYERALFVGCTVLAGDYFSKNVAFFGGQEMLSCEKKFYMCYTAMIMAQ